MPLSSDIEAAASFQFLLRLFLLAKNGLGPGNVTLHSRDLLRVGELARRQLETKVEQLGLQLGDLGVQLLRGQKPVTGTLRVLSYLLLILLKNMAVRFV